MTARIKNRPVVVTSLAVLVSLVGCFSEPNPSVDASSGNGGASASGGNGGRSSVLVDGNPVVADVPIQGGAGGVPIGGAGGSGGTSLGTTSSSAGGIPGSGGVIGATGGVIGATGGVIGATGGVIGATGGVIGATGGSATGGTGGGGLSGSGGVTSLGGLIGSGGRGSGGIVATGGSVTGGALGTGGRGSGGVVGSGGTPGTGGSPCPSPAPCTVGSYSCSGSTLQSCTANAAGCPVVTNDKVCGSDTPVCNASAKRCDCDSNAASTCNGVNARLVCSSSTGQWGNVACTGAKPACVAGACVACTEHNQCPGGACHLSGAKAGTCFASGSVIRATSLANLQSAISSLASPGELAVMLASGSYTTTNQVSVKSGQEVAIVGESGQPRWSGNGTWSDARNPMINVEGSGILYVGNIRMVETTPGSTAISASSGSTLWIDDFFTSGYQTGVSSAASELHVRRSFVQGAGASSLYIYAGTVFVENSAIGPLLNSPESGIAGIMTGSASIVLDIRYSTIVGGQQAIQCNGAPQPSGALRNSLLLCHSTSASPIPASCSTLNQSGNFAPTIFYTPSWFVDAANGNFHLSAGGKAAVTQTAQWASGDPTVDIDGNPRPQSAKGYPGIDQP